MKSDVLLKNNRNIWMDKMISSYLYSRKLNILKQKVGGLMNGVSIISSSDSQEEEEIFSFGKFRYSHM